MTRTESQNTFAPLSALGPIGYSGTAWVNGKGSLSAQRATNGQAITVTRAGAGLYFVNFPGAFNGTFNQTVQLTDGAGFTGTSRRHCSVNLPQATGTTVHRGGLMRRHRIRTRGCRFLHHGHVVGRR